MTLGFGLDFSRLATRDGLVALDKIFLERLSGDEALYRRLLAARAEPESLDAKAEGELVIALGEALEPFLGELFGIGAELDAAAAETAALDPIHSVKRLFVQRQAVKKYADPAGFDGPALRAALEARMAAAFDERGFAVQVLLWEKNEVAGVSVAQAA